MTRYPRDGLDEALWLDWRERDRLIRSDPSFEETASRDDQYAGLNELMKSDKAKKVTDSCEFRLKAFALGPTVEDKRKCMMGNNADYDRCGCVLPFHRATIASRRLMLKETVKRLAV